MEKDRELSVKASSWSHSWPSKDLLCGPSECRKEMEDTELGPGNREETNSLAWKHALTASSCIHGTCFIAGTDCRCCEQPLPTQIMVFGEHPDYGVWRTETSGDRSSDFQSYKRAYALAFDFLSYQKDGRKENLGWKSVHTPQVG